MINRKRLLRASAFTGVTLGVLGGSTAAFACAADYPGSPPTGTPTWVQPYISPNLGGGSPQCNGMATGVMPLTFPHGWNDVAGVDYGTQTGGNEPLEGVHGDNFRTCKFTGGGPDNVGNAKSLLWECTQDVAADTSLHDKYIVWAKNSVIGDTWSNPFTCGTSSPSVTAAAGGTLFPASPASPDYHLHIHTHSNINVPDMSATSTCVSEWSGHVVVDQK